MPLAGGHYFFHYFAERVKNGDETIVFDMRPVSFFIYKSH